MPSTPPGSEKSKAMASGTPNSPALPLPHQPTPTPQTTGALEEQAGGGRKQQRKTWAPSRVWLSQVSTSQQASKSSGDQPAPHPPYLLVTSFHKYSKVSTSIPLLSLGPPSSPKPVPPITAPHISSCSRSIIYDDTPRKTIKPYHRELVKHARAHTGWNIMLPLKITFQNII